MRAVRGSSTWRRPCRLALCCLGLAAAPAPAQAPAPRQPTDTLAAVAILRESREYARAIVLLEAYTRDHPDDSRAAHLLVETIYWTGNPARAIATARHIVRRQPHNAALRVLYARMLLESGELSRARSELEPLVPTAAGAQALTLLGTLEYWAGDYTRAARLFREALRRDPQQADARRQLGEIRAASAPWMGVDARVRADDQPLQELATAVRVGWFATPLAHTAIRARLRRVEGDLVSDELRAVEIGHDQYLARARLDIALAAGPMQRSSAAGTDWTGRAALGVRLGNLRLRADYLREPYLFTIASLSAPIMTRAVSLAMDWSHRSGRLAQSAVQRQLFPDANGVSTAHAWLLAPVATGNAAQLQLGASVNVAHADESRFVLRQPAQGVAPSDPSFDFSGHYAPYHAPARLAAASALGALRWSLGPRSTVRVSGAYGVSSDDAPVFLLSQNQVVRGSYRRVFFPWRAESSLEIGTAGGLAVVLGANAHRSPYYRGGGIGMSVMQRFGVLRRYAGH